MGALFSISFKVLKQQKAIIVIVLCCFILCVVLMQYTIAFAKNLVLDYSLFSDDFCYTIKTDNLTAEEYLKLVDKLPNNIKGVPYNTYLFLGTDEDSGFEIVASDKFYNTASNDCAFSDAAADGVFSSYGFNYGDEYEFDGRKYLVTQLIRSTEIQLNINTLKGSTEAESFYIHLSKNISKNKNAAITKELEQIFKNDGCTITGPKTTSLIKTVKDGVFLPFIGIAFASFLVVMYAVVYLEQEKNLSFNVVCTFGNSKQKYVLAAIIQTLGIFTIAFAAAVLFYHIAFVWTNTSNTLAQLLFSDTMYIYLTFQVMLCVSLLLHYSAKKGELK